MTINAPQCREEHRSTHASAYISNISKFICFALATHTQFLASTAKNLLILDIGLSVAFPTIVIAALTGLNNSNNQNEFLSLTSVQSSWLGELHNKIHSHRTISLTIICRTNRQRWLYLRATGCIGIRMANRTIGTQTSHACREHTASDCMDYIVAGDDFVADIFGQNSVRPGHWADGGTDSNLRRRNCVSIVHISLG